MRIVKAAALLVAVCLFVPTMAHAAPNPGPSVAGFLASLSAEVASGLEGVGLPPVIQLTCSDTAWCGSSGTSVTCSGGTCGLAVDQYCAGGVRGYAICDGVRTYCPACPSTCNKKACDASCGGPGYGVCSGNNCICL